MEGDGAGAPPPAPAPAPPELGIADALVANVNVAGAGFVSVNGVGWKNSVVCPAFEPSVLNILTSVVSSNDESGGDALLVVDKSLVANENWVNWKRITAAICLQWSLSERPNW